jgi:hypothetical protein
MSSLHWVLLPFAVENKLSRGTVVCGFVAELFVHPLCRQETVMQDLPF